jgi:tetratricopeptide (TPR) repeat protein
MARLPCPTQNDTSRIFTLGLKCNSHPERVKIDGSGPPQSIAVRDMFTLTDIMIRFNRIPTVIVRRPAMRIPDFRARLGVWLAALVLVAWSGWAAGQEAPAAAAGISAEAHLGKGYDALKQDAYEAAVSEFRAALQIDSSLVLRARFPMAVALFELHKSEEARRELEAVRHEAGDHPNVLYYLGRLDLEERNFDSAIRNLQKAAVKPPFPDTAYYLGFAYFKRGDLAEAEKWLKEAARLNPRDARVLYQLGFVYRKEGRAEEAKKTLAESEELRRRDDIESQLKTECGKKLEEGPREEAHRICGQLYAPDDADKLTALGTIYGQHGDLEAALKPFQRAAELAPHSPQMQYNLALVYYQLNQFSQARAPLSKALERWPDLFQVNSLYGAVLLKLGEDVPAYQALQHARQLNPQDPGTTDLLYQSTLVLARKAQSARQYSNSLRYLQEAVKLHPEEPEPHRSLAEIYSATDHPAEATAERERADSLSHTSQSNRRQ